MIKQIGTEARQDLEAFFECKVYLDLRVKVKSDWRDDERVAGRPGLAETTTRCAKQARHRHPAARQLPELFHPSKLNIQRRRQTGDR